MKPGAYGKTTSGELKAISTLYGLLDFNFVVPHINALDRIPNHDGYLELLDGNRELLGIINVQVKKIPDGTFSYQCASALVAHSVKVSLPFILICVDVGFDRAYYRHLTHLTPEFRELQESFKINFDVAQDEIASGGGYLLKWRKLVAEYNQRVAKYEELASEYRALLKEMGDLKVTLEKLKSNTTLSLSILGAGKSIDTSDVRKFKERSEILGALTSPSSHIAIMLTQFLAWRGTSSDAVTSYEIVESAFSRWESRLLHRPSAARQIRVTINETKASTGITGILGLRDEPELAPKKLGIGGYLAEAFLTPPKYLDKYKFNWNLLPTEAVSDYGTREAFPAIPWYSTIEGPERNCVSCCLIAATMMYRHIRAVPSLKEVLDGLGIGERYGTTDGISSHDILQFFNKLEDMVAYAEFAKQKRDLPRFLHAYNASGFPVILVVNMNAMKDVFQSNHIYMPGIRGDQMWPHALVVVGTNIHRKLIAVNDPDSFPFLIIEDTQLEQIGLKTFPLDYISILPKRVKLPLLDAEGLVGLSTISRLFQTFFGPTIGLKQKPFDLRDDFRLIQVKDFVAGNQLGEWLSKRFSSEFGRHWQHMQLSAEHWLWIERLDEFTVLIWDAERMIKELPKSVADVSTWLPLLAFARITEQGVSVTQMNI